MNGDAWELQDKGLLSYAQASKIANAALEGLKVIAAIEIEIHAAWHSVVFPEGEG
jgi:hypothetical protein